GHVTERPGGALDQADQVRIARERLSRRWLPSPAVIIRLPDRLDPDERVSQGLAGARGRGGPERTARRVAPVIPRTKATAARVDNKVLAGDTTDAELGTDRPPEGDFGGRVVVEGRVEEEAIGLRNTGRLQARGDFVRLPIRRVASVDVDRRVRIRLEF